MMKKMFFWTFIAFILASTTAIFPLTRTAGRLNDGSETGEFSIAGVPYQYLRDAQRVVVSHVGRTIWEAICPDNRHVMLGFDYSPRQSSFVAFFGVYQAGAAQLVMESGVGRQVLAESPQYEFYSPLLVEEGERSCVLFIDEAFSIRAIDPADNSQRIIYSGNSPLMELISSHFNGQSVIGVRRFEGGRYVSYCFPTHELFSGQQVDLHLLPSSIPSATPIENKEDIQRLRGATTLPAPGRNPAVFVAFGDSITEGGNCEPNKIPSFVVRLNRALGNVIPGVEVENAGLGKEGTLAGLERFEGVIRRTNCGYFYYMEGTNDSVAWDYPLSVVLRNIRYVLERCIELGVQPIPATLLPFDASYERVQKMPWAIERARKIAEGVREIAASLDLPLADCYRLFAEYPASKGGLTALICDGLHPSIAGTQIIADEYFRTTGTLFPIALNVKSPVDRQYIYGRMPIQVDATHRFGIVNVQFYLADSLKEEDKTSPFAFLFDTLAYPNGAYPVTIRAIDKFNLYREQKLTVNIANILVNIDVKRKEAQSWMVKKQYGEITLAVEKPNGFPGIVERYSVYRRDNTGDFHLLYQIPESAFSGGRYVYRDKYLEKDKSYTYKIEALDTAGAVCGRSVEKTL